MLWLQICIDSKRYAPNNIFSISPISFSVNANFSINFVEFQVYQEGKYCDKAEIAYCKKYTHTRFDS